MNNKMTSKPIEIINIESDRYFLIWLHQRLVEKYKEDEAYDYMYRLRSIILNIPKDQKSNTFYGGNCYEDLIKMLYDQDKNKKS